MSFKSEFKDFIAKGNVMDMAVGVVVGGAFKGIVDSLVGDILNPVISLCFSAINKATQTVAEVAGDSQAGVENVMDMSKWVIPGTAINIGNFISSVLNFLIMAFVIFCMVKFVNKLRLGFAEQKEEEEEEAALTQEELLEQIRDFLAAKSECEKDSAAAPVE